MKKRILYGLRKAFCLDRTVCRLAACWFAFAAWMLLQNGFDFYKTEYAMDTELISVLLRLLLLFCLLSVLSVLAADFSLDSWLLLAFFCVCIHYWIQSFSNQSNRFLFLLAVLAAFVPIVLYFVRQNMPLFQRWKPQKHVVLWLIALGGVFACTVLSVTMCLRYKTFSSPNFDFGLFCNMFYNMKKTGLPLATSERDRLLSHFAVHISPAFYVLLPFYWLFPYPETLQIGQAVFLMAGVIPVVLLARHFQLSGKVTLVVSLLYVFYPAISTGCFYDIHENCFLPFFLLWLFYFYEKKKWIPMYLAAFFVLGVKEDAAIYLFIFAIFLLLSEKNYLHGALLALLSVAYFGLAYFLLETYGTGVFSSRFDNLIYDEEAGIFGIVKLALVNPGYLLTQLFTTSGGTWDKIEFLLSLLLPLGFLPFCSKKLSRWLLLTPMLINLLSYYIYLYDLNFQYHFAVAAFLVYAMLKNLPELTLLTRQNLLAIAAAACCCIYLASVVPRLQTYTSNWLNNSETYTQMEEILDAVPQDASVACSSFLLAHLSDRDEIYEVYYHENKPDVDFVVLDARTDSYRQYERAYLRQGYTLWREYDGLIVILVSPENATGA